MLNNIQNALENSPHGLSASSAPPPAELKVITDDGQYGKFTVELLSAGWGTIIGNSFRRILLNSLEGTAVTWIRIGHPWSVCTKCNARYKNPQNTCDKCKDEESNPVELKKEEVHEAAAIRHVLEGVNELIDNIKGIRLRNQGVKRPGRLRLEVVGKGEVKAGDFMASSDFEVVNPNHHLAYLDSDEAELSLEVNIDSGIGFQEAIHSKDHPAGTISVDAIFAPILKSSFAIEPRRYQNFTDLECLVLEVWTDGTLSPTDAVEQAARLMIEKCNIFLDSGDSDKATIARSKIDPEIYGRLVEKLDLSARASNALTRAGFTRLGEVLETPRTKLLNIRNFGQKSFDELLDKLDELKIEHPWNSFDADNPED